MSIIFKIILYPILLVIFIVALLPSKNFYYFLQHYLYNNYKITLKQKSIRSTPLYFDITNLEIGLDNEQVATINKISISLYLAKNTIVINNIAVDDTLTLPMLRGLKNVKIIYALTSPLDIKIKINSPVFSKASVHMDLLTRTLKFSVYIKISQEDKISNILPYLKQQRKGVYVYEYKF